MSNDKKTLTSSVVDNRPGYVDHRMQVYALPKANKRIDAWKQRMQAKGWKLES